MRGAREDAWGSVGTALDDARTAVRLFGRMRRLLGSPISLVRARAALRDRLDRREADFLDLVRRGIYEDRRNPYRALLAHAGCEPGDLGRLVAADGVEGALQTLLRAGVYLTVDELKGRRPIVRGSLTLAADPGAFRNAAVRVGFPFTSGGSRGEGMRVGVGVDFTWEWYTNQLLIFEAREGLDWRFALWGVPGGAALATLLGLRIVTRTAPQFFSILDRTAERKLHPRYRWSLRMLRAAGALAGRPFPPVAHAPLADPMPLVRWVDAVRAGGETPHVQTYASAAVRLAQSALAAGSDLRGVQLKMTGEPTTPARRAAVEESGAVVVPHMGNTEVGTVVASGCLDPDGSDDMHVIHDLLALIQPGSWRVADLPSQTLLASSIRPQAPLLLLNASLGDGGTLSDRACGCPLGNLGWTTHLSEVRSYEKLTAGGMTFYRTDLARVLEEVLPARFGGGPLDYQLVEGEGRHGEPVLRLLVHPRVGPVAPEAVSAGFLEAIGPGRGLGRVMGEAWREGGFITVERRPPEVTPAGKTQHFHSARRRPAPAEA